MQTLYNDDVFQILVGPFFQHTAKVYTSFCCERLFVGIDKPKGCRSCKKTLEVREVFKKSFEDTSEKEA